MKKMVYFLLSLRPKQWVAKNILIFAAMIFSLHIFETVYIFRSLLAFCIFSLIAGSIYVFNDIIDREKDRLHPEKRNRPIASGKLDPALAAWLAGILLASSMGASYFLSREFFIITSIYVIQNILYSFYLKHMVIIDIMVLAFGFVLRVMAGAVVNGIHMYPWILISTFLGAVFLALIKRRQELVKMAAVNNRGDTRHTLKIYTVSLLDQMISISTATTLIAYIMYVLSPDVQAKFGTDRLFYTVPFVIFAIFRYLYLSYTKGEGESPSEIIYTDLPFTLSGILWVVLFILLVKGVI